MHQNLTGKTRENVQPPYIRCNLSLDYFNWIIVSLCRTESCQRCTQLNQFSVSSPVTASYQFLSYSTIAPEAVFFLPWQ